MMRTVTKIGLFLFLALFPIIASADTVVLQSGETLEVETSWLSKDQVCFSINGLKLSIPRRYVKRIEGSRVGAKPQLCKQESGGITSARTSTGPAGPEAKSNDR